MASRALLVLVFVAAFATAANESDYDKTAKHHLKSAPTEMMNIVTDSVLRSHVRYLADPLLEGRGTGMRGEKLAGKYIASVLESLGVEPYGDNGTFIQSVPFRRVEPTSLGQMTLTKDAATKTTLTWGSDYLGSTQSSKTSITLDNDEIIFVGYGFDDSSAGWDDFKGVNVTNKIVLALIGTPATLTGKTAMSGRAATKITTAASKGAKGLITITSYAISGYTWSAMMAREGSALMRPTWSSYTYPIDFYAYVNESDAGTWLSMFGKTVAGIIAEAESSSFVPYSMGNVSVSAVFTNSIVYGNNVVGIIKGNVKPEEAIVFSSHEDHLGIGYINKLVYPGAGDNALGCAIHLAIAKAISQFTLSCKSRHLPRSVIFLFPTAEELGLYGAQYWMAQTQAKGDLTILGNINYDIGNIWGKTHDVIVFGRTEDTLAREVADFAAKPERMIAEGDPDPSSGTLARGDHYVFYQYNIPFAWVFTGTKFYGYENYTRADGVVDPDYVGEVAWYKYATTVYHTPNDKYSDAIDLSGSVQLARVGLRMGYSILAGKYVPKML